MPSIEMSWPTVISFYIRANLLFAGAAALLAAIRGLSTILPRPLTYRHLLAIGRALALSALVLPAIAMWRGGGDFSPLRAQVWSAPSMQIGARTIPDAARIEFQLVSQHASFSLHAAAVAALLLFATGMLMTLLPLTTEGWATFRAVRRAHVVRRIGRVRVLVSDREYVPFAAWTPGQYWIVLPAALLMRPADLRIALRHEAQHHRHGDTRYLYAMLLCRALFGLNPAVHWLARQLFELQEFACDEVLAQHEGQCPRAYCACLLRIAESALPAQSALLRSFMAGSRAFALARRVEAALRRPARPLHAPAAVTVSLLAVAMLTGISAVIATPVEDRRLSLKEAESLAAAMQTRSTFPLEVNDAVLRQLNLLLGTPDGRAFVRSSIARMQDYAPSVLAELRRYGLPTELLAVPLVESGYRDLPPKGNAGAGLWMFIAPTARHYELEVSASRDERLDVRAETRAAMRMFSDLQRHFQDWSLALMAYNSGTTRVEAGVRATYSRDAWKLYRAGYGNDPDYLARTVAVMLILANPRLLN